MNEDYENNSIVENVNEEFVEEQESRESEVLEELDKIKEEIGFLRDLFVRRLSEDKQKVQLIDALEKGASFAFIEPFLSDIFLVLDRLEKRQDDFIQSVYEELYGILNRRGVERIPFSEEFNPAFFKAVKKEDDPEMNCIKVTHVIRNGYTFCGKVVRPMEVIVKVPVAHKDRLFSNNNE